MIVAVSGASVVGMGALHGARIKRMYVQREFRHLGIGRRIHEILAREARTRHVGQLTLESSLNAVEFYRRLGYQDVRRHVWHLKAARITNMIMTKTLEKTCPPTCEQGEG